MGPTTAALWALGSAGQPGREIAARLNLLWAIGPRDAMRRARARTPFVSEGDEHPAYQRIWNDAARAVGAELTRLGGGFFELTNGPQTIRVWNHWVPLDDIVTTRLALDKPLVHQILGAAGIRVPEHCVIERRDIAVARAFVLAAPDRCVVKPASLGGGSGTTAGIGSDEELKAALLRAGRVADRVLIERQVAGDVYRLLYLDGELLDVVRRLPPRVTGDGRSTVHQLIEAENQRRIALLNESGPPLVRPDLDCALTLARAGLSLASVPRAGVAVSVGTLTSQNGPNDNETVPTNILAPPLIADARRAVEVVGLRLAGVDVVTSDPTRSLRDTGGVVLEINGTPGLHHHYNVADPDTATPVAVPVLRGALRIA